MNPTPKGFWSRAALTAVPHLLLLELRDYAVERSRHLSLSLTLTPDTETADVRALWKSQFERNRTRWFHCVSLLLKLERVDLKLDEPNEPTTSQHEVVQDIAEI